MPLHVLHQVVRPHERPAAHRADKLALAGVQALVPRQLVTPGKDLAAGGEGAGEGLLARVYPVVRLQVRHLEVGFVAVGLSAGEHLFPLLGRRRRLLGDQDERTGCRSYPGRQGGQAHLASLHGGILGGQGEKDGKGGGGAFPVGVLALHKDLLFGGVGRLLGDGG